MPAHFVEQCRAFHPESHSRAVRTADHPVSTSQGLQNMFTLSFRK